MLYYLRSRYYNPEWGRFINADVFLGYAGAILGHNQFNYCSNNSINYTDPDGMSSFSARNPTRHVVSIKAYRLFLKAIKGEESFDTLSDYINDHFRFLSESNKLRIIYEEAAQGTLYLSDFKDKFRYECYKYYRSLFPVTRVPAPVLIKTVYTPYNDNDVRVRSTPEGKRVYPQ